MKKAICIAALALLLSACEKRLEKQEDGAPISTPPPPAPEEQPEDKPSGNAQKATTEKPEPSKKMQERLFVAIYYGKLEDVRKLIAAGVDINARDGKGDYPLHEAITQGHFEVAKVLIENGADVNSHDMFGANPLDAAITFSNTELFKLLLDNGANCQPKKSRKFLATLLERALEADTPEILRVLIRRNLVPMDTKLNGQTLVQYAICKNNPALLQMLIEEGADAFKPDDYGLTPLDTAVQQELTEVVRILLVNRADPDSSLKDGNTLLHYAAKMRNVAIARLLVEYGARLNAVNDSGETPLDVADSDEMKALLLRFSAVSGEELKQREGK